ncbi:MAG: flagellar biosynthetic protein FliQ [Planctomycetota bacterium]|nr:flagellar biosynthetic protein FliQ [Planctomycetota bacterium]
MDLDTAVDMIRQSLVTAAWLCAPVLGVCLLVGLLVSVLQAATQVQEPTVNLVPRITAAVITLLLLLPWGLQMMVDYTVTLWTSSP